MPGATWDMHTSGDDSGQVKRPLVYTATDDDATRVKVYLRLATELGTHKLRMREGLDRERILDANTTDAERGAIVAALVFEDPRVVAITTGPTVAVDLLTAEVSVTLVLRTISGALLPIGI